MVFTIAVGLPHHTFHPNFESISLALFDCCMDSKGKKRTSILGLYEAMVLEVGGIVVLTLVKSAFSPNELGLCFTLQQQSFTFGNVNNA
jgi:hypothetical protein